MTAPYERNPLPHMIDVRCPNCGGQAVFEFAESVRIKKADVSFFEANSLFEVVFVPGSYTQPGNRHMAIYYHGLHRNSLDSITDLPDGYAPSSWAHSRYWTHSTQKGTVRCDACHKRQKHTLNWPTDAYFQTDVRGETLWAFNRESLVALRNYVAATQRDKVRHESFTLFLMKVPTHFLRAKVREETLRKLQKLLEL